MLRSAFFALALTHGLAASALTMTFNDIGKALQSPPGAENTYSENGIIASSGPIDLGYWGQPGTLHLDDSGTPIASTVSFTANGRFDAVSFDVFSVGQTELYYDIYNPVVWDEIIVRGIPYDNVNVQGFRSGALVAQDNFYSGDFSTYFFDPAQFADLDSLIISAQMPSLSAIESIKSALAIDYPDYTVDSIGCFNTPCGHFNIDNLVLNPQTALPLPGSLPLLGIGLISLGIARRRPALSTRIERKGRP